MKLTPAKDFVDSPHFRGWLDLVSEPQFQEAAKAALIAFTAEAVKLNNGQFQLEGAIRFLDILMTLGETKPVIHRVDTVNLPHR